MTDKRDFVSEEWLTREDMERLMNVHAFHAYLAETEHDFPDHEITRLIEETPIEVVILRDGE